MGGRRRPYRADFDSRLYRRIEAQAPWWDLLLHPLRSFRHVTLRRALPAAADGLSGVSGGGTTGIPRRFAARPRPATWRRWIRFNLNRWSARWTLWKC